MSTNTYAAWPLAHDGRDETLFVARGKREVIGGALGKEELVHLALGLVPPVLSLRAEHLFCRGVAGQQAQSDSTPQIAGQGDAH